MKLQSQATRRFDARELRRLARRSRPEHPATLFIWITAGFALGTLLVGLVRYLD